MNSHSEASIGIFDSGVGGLTVLHAIKRILPQENLIYFADSARLPYGSKSNETICQYTLESAFFLLQYNIKLLVIACHTACTAALKSLRTQFNIPVVAITEAAVERVNANQSWENIALLGTTATIQSKYYQNNLSKSKQLYCIPCPLFVPLIEEGCIDHPQTTHAIEQYLDPIKNAPIDALLLACTHYPLLKNKLMQELNKSIDFIDPAEDCAHHIKAILIQNHLINENNPKPFERYFVSDNPSKFQSLSEALFLNPIEKVEAKLLQRLNLFA